MIQSVQTERPSVAKRIAKAAVVTTAAAGTALYLAKTGKLDRFTGKNAHVDKGIAGLKTAADKIWTKLEPQVAKVKPMYDKVAAKVKPAVESATKKVSATAKEVAGKVKPMYNKAKTFVTGLFTSAKAAITRFFSNFSQRDTVVEAMAGKFNP